MSKLLRGELEDVRCDHKLPVLVIFPNNKEFQIIRAVCAQIRRQLLLLLLLPHFDAMQSRGFSNLRIILFYWFASLEVLFGSFTCSARKSLNCLLLFVPLFRVSYWLQVTAF